MRGGEGYSKSYINKQKYKYINLIYMQNNMKWLQGNKIITTNKYHIDLQFSHKTCLKAHISPKIILQ